MMKKAFVFLLILSLSIATCFASADEAYTVLNESGYELQLLPGLERKELTEEDIALGLLDRFEDEKTGKTLTVYLNTELSGTAEDCINTLMNDPSVITPGITDTGDAKFVSWFVTENGITTKHVVLNPETGKYVQISIVPYDSEDREDWRPIELMVYSLRKAK